MFDIIYWIDVALAYKKHGKLVKFEFPPISMFVVEKVLNEYGVHTYGRKVTREGRSFLVAEKQAEYAEYLCFAAGYPKLGTLYPKNEAYRGKGLPKRKWQKGGRKKNPIFAFGDAMSKVVDFLS